MEMALNLLPNNAMTFTENQHGTAVLEKLRNQRELMRCCDVILHVAGNQFQAHRCVLAACSPYFDSIFKAGKTVKEQLTISSQDPEVFRCLLAYMYTGTVVVDKTNVAELLRLANRLLIAKLKEHCAEYLERYLDASNCLTVRDMATKYNLKGLEKTTGTFICTHLSEVVEGDEVLEMSHTRLEDFLGCQNWHLHEDQTLLLVTRWVHHCPKTRERNLRSLLTWVQWPRLDPKTPIHLIQTHPLYTSSSRLALFFLLDALNEHSLLPSDFITPFANLKAKFSQSSDSVVDNESFFSLAISTAIDEFQEDQHVSGRTQEAMPTVTDFSINSSAPSHSGSQSLPFDVEDANNPANMSLLPQLHKINDFHVTSRRENDDQGPEQCNQYDSCRLMHNTQDLHGSLPTLVYSQPVPSGKETACHAITSEDLVGDSESVEDGKFSCNSQGHFGQPLVRNLTVWHQEPPYNAEESLSSDSGQMYQRQMYDQNFSIKTPCPESFTSRVNPQNMYTMREPAHKNKQGFASAMSYYVSTYNPDDDMTVSDDQSTQSFPYDENFNPGVNFYSCRQPDIKESQHLMIESHHGKDNYGKSYYHETTTQDMSCNQAELYYNENSTDTQLSNCPQDMTIQVKDMSQNIETEEISNSPDNARVNSLSDRIFSDEQHYDHYPPKPVENKFHRELSRSVPVEEPMLSMAPRDMVGQEFLLDGKRLSVDCDIEGRSLVAVVGGPFEGDKTLKTCSLENEEETLYKESRVPDEKDFTGMKHEENMKDSIAVNIEGSLLDRQQTHVMSSLDNTPRQVKFKINRSCSQGASGISSSIGQDLTVPSEPSFTNATPVTDFIDMIKIDTHKVDPGDDPHTTPNVTAEDCFNKEVVTEKQDSSVQEAQDLLSTTITKDDNVESVVREDLKRTCQKDREKEKKRETASKSERVCELCQTSFSQTRLYFSHMKEHFPGPPHNCDNCEASFKRIYHLLEHRITHQENKAHKCPHCPFRAHKKFNLTEHLSQHLKKTAKFKCKTCGDSFFRVHNLKIHETKHTTERPFLCESCGWAGKTKNALIVHTKTHTGELLRCQYSTCVYATAKKSHLKEHMLQHSNSRGFTCEDCGRSFITNSHLKRHVKQHLPEKKLKCFQCDYRSSRQDHLKAHVRKKHTFKGSTALHTKKKQCKRKNKTVTSTKHQTIVTSTITAHIDCSQGDIFSDLENTNISLQPQLSGTPPPTTLSEYPASPSYTFPSQSAPEDSLIIVSDMASVTEGFTPLNQTYEGSYHSPQYQTSPSHFAVLSPTHTTLSYSTGPSQEESPLNFAACMKYD